MRSMQVALCPAVAAAVAVVGAVGAVGAPCAAQTVLEAHPSPADNGGSPGWAIFFDLEGLEPGLVVTHLVTASTAAAGAEFEVEVFTREGTALGGLIGPGSAVAGWTSLGVASATQGAAGSSGVSEPIDIPDIDLGGGGLTGVAIQFTGVGPRYFGTGTPPYEVYSDGRLRLTTGDSRSAPFTSGGSFFTSRELVGSLTYTSSATPCYADCDASGELDFFDFLCFQNAFAAGEPYADCDESGGHDFFDFLCFQNAFAAGCP